MDKFPTLPLAPLQNCHFAPDVYPHLNSFQLLHTNVLQVIIFVAGLEKPATINGMTDYTDILDVIVAQALSDVPRVF